MGEFRRLMPRGLEWIWWVAFAPAWVALALLDSSALAFGWFVFSRAAYVLFVGISLRAQEGSRWYTRRYGAEEGYRRFRGAVWPLMTNDFFAVVLACWCGRNTVTTSLEPWMLSAVGVLLFAGGIGVRMWATASLPDGAYFWKGCFVPFQGQRFVVSGPYRWFSNPMYTVGYLHAYGFALACRSLPGLAAAVLAQAGILAMNLWAERPHTENLRRAKEVPAGREAARRAA